MKRVVVSQRVEAHPDRNETRDALDQRLVALLFAAGYAAVPISSHLVTLDEDGRALNAWISALAPFAIVLSGGNDVGSCEPRDRTEAALLAYAASGRLPVLGLCRGMQMMAVHAGGTLRAVEAHVRTRHSLSGEIRHEVNSYHNQTLADCPPGYRVLARSEDGAIEAIRHVERVWEGWMWHPEREQTFNQEDVLRIRMVLGDP